MLRVLEECDNVAADFAADPVHDLRVSLRRCRSVADGMMAMDPDPNWKARKRAGKQVFQNLALERWTAARKLHVRAMRTRSQIALHTLRIGIKRFRYIVENSLPEEHKLWSNDLKHMQALLGEVHDLDVLWATALECRIFPDEPTR